MQMDIRHDRGITIALPDTDRLTLIEARVFTDAIGELVAAGDYVVVDMHRVRIVDSAGVGAFLSAHRAAKAAGGGLRLAGLRPQVATLVRVVRMDRLIEMFPTVEQAVADWSEVHPAVVGMTIANGPDGSEQG